MRTSLAFCVAAAVITAPCAARPDQETVSFTNVASSGLLNASANSVIQHTFNGGYPLGLVTFSGTLTSMNPRTWRTDSRILVKAPGGAVTTIQPFTTGTTFTSLPFSGSVIVAPGTDPAGQWTFRFYETFVDAAPGQMDARWDITINLTNNPPPPPAATDLGAMLAPGRVVQNVTVQFGAVKWYTFTIPWEAHPGLSTYLDIDTVGSVFAASAGSGSGPNDTQLALYSATGELLHIDDDSGPGYTSQLSFGAGTRPATGDGEPRDGRNGPLPAGTYYLAAAPYQVQFGSAYWSVTPIDTRSGTLTLNFGTNITAAAPACYANCDGSTIAPVLNVQDFACFLNAFAGGDPYANCDQSTTAPILNVQDFACFLNRFAAGCP